MKLKRLILKLQIFYKFYVQQYTVKLLNFVCTNFPSLTTLDASLAPELLDFKLYAM